MKHLLSALLAPQTGGVLIAPPKDLANFFSVWRRAAAPFGLLTNGSFETGANFNARDEVRARARLSLRASRARP
jgi:hypothetical protein